MSRCKKQLFAFDSKAPLPLLGQFQYLLEAKKLLVPATFIVVRNATGCLLRAKISIDINFLTIKDNIVHPQPEKSAPLNVLPIPLQAWDTVYADFLGSLPRKDLLLVVIDVHTRSPAVEIVRTTNVSSTINGFNQIFATHGLRRTIVSDNGPPCQSEELREYKIANGTRNRKITPLLPQANAKAETFIKPVQKCLQTAVMVKKEWK